MTFLQHTGRGPRTDVISDHERLRNLDRGNPHPQYALADHTHVDVDQAGVEEIVYSAATSASGSVVFPTAFAAAPVVTATLVIGSNHDFNLNLQGVTTTGFSWRMFQNSGSSLTGSGSLHWHAMPAT